MTYQSMLDATMPELETKHLERYIAGYESGALEHGHCGRCAVGHMNREPGEAEGAAYDRYDAEEGMACMVARNGEELTPLNRIEIVFEDWGCEMVGQMATGPADDATRRRMIYDACVMELAKRNSTSTPRVALPAAAAP